MQHQSTNAIKTVCTTISGASPTNPVFIIETYKSGDNWYRKYSDGVIEQGGKLNNLSKDARVSGSFIKAYTNASSVSMHFTFISTSSYSDRRGGLAVDSIAKNGFYVHSDNYVNNSGGYYWIARGV